MVSAGKGRRERRRGSERRRGADNRDHGRFKTGDKVEARSDEEGFIGVWYSAEVVHVEPASASVTVEYDQLLDEQGRPLQEMVLLRNLRPHPPCFPKRSWLRGDHVEAYDKDGWWKGVITHIIGPSGPILVYFYSTGEEIGFPPARLRRHQCWQEGEWTDLTQVGSSTDAVPKENCTGAKITDPSSYGNLGELPSLQVGNPDPEKISEAVTTCQELLCDNDTDHGWKAVIALCAHRAAEDDVSGEGRENNRTAMTRWKSKDDYLLATSPLPGKSCEHLELDPGQCSGAKASSGADEGIASQANTEDEKITDPQNAEDIGCMPLSATASCILTGCENHCRRSNKTRKLEYGAYRMLLQALHSKGALDWKQELLLTEVRCQLDITNLEHACALKEVLFSKEMANKGPPV